MTSTDQNSLLRILDANANRTSEGLRVVEEYVRMVLDDRHLTGLYKQLRHDLTTSLAGLDSAELTSSRDTPGDVGTEITTAEELNRPAIGDVVTANLKRVEQALRCLEEYSKPLDPPLAAAVKSLRYRAYTLAGAVNRTRRAADELTHARLYVLMDGRETGPSAERLVAQLADAGVDIFQLRDKRLDDRRLFKAARTLRAATRATSTWFIVNDRPDVAAAVDADGVHVGQSELPVPAVRKIVGPNRWIGVSTHSVEQARAAVLDGADYLGCGPTFPSKTKTFADFPGPAFLRAVQAEIRLPAFAIGGIDEDNLAEVLETGFQRVAVSSSLLDSDQPDVVARRLKSALTAVGRR